ncbi:hypothetical protein P9112_006781 [Eukaryota sp. TZLM1-RC]
MSDTVALTLNGETYEFSSDIEGTPLIDVAYQCGVHIPRMCYHPSTKVIGTCGVCMVQCAANADAKPKNALACKTAFKSGMIVDTEAPKVVTARKKAMDRLEKKKNNRNSLVEDPSSLIDSTISIKIDPSSCIECNRCVKACQNQGMNILSYDKSKEAVRPIVVNNGSLDVSGCIGCGACTLVCPTGSISETPHLHKVIEAIRDPSKVVVVQTAPTVRTQFGEPWGISPSAEVTGKMTSALRTLGFDFVFDTQFAADMAIMEEAHELLERLKKKWANEEVALPQFTSCCPAWVNMVEQHYPDKIPNLSTTKSPMAILGAIVKSWFAESVINTAPENVVSVAVMPCTAKSSFTQERDPAMDYVITIREFIEWMKTENVDFTSLEPTSFDNPLGESSGAGTIFSVTGGVCEAALRTATDVATGGRLGVIDFEGVRGEGGMRTASVELEVDGIPRVINVAICSGAIHARKLLEDENLRDRFDFIEVMSCPGGCVAGKGGVFSDDPDIVKKRISSVYKSDKKCTIRRSHENPSIQKLYQEFFGHPLSHKSHELLHQSFIDRSHNLVKQ